MTENKNLIRQAFTLVELLMVIVIVGVLMALLVPAVQSVRTTVREGIVVTQIGQLDMALASYKAEVGEYPPDGLDYETMERHLRKRFPRYRYDPSHFDLDVVTPETALVFWLNGPDNRGFSADPSNPWKESKPTSKKYLDSDLIRPDMSIRIQTEIPIRYMTECTYLQKLNEVYESYVTVTDPVTGETYQQGVSYSPPRWSIEPFEGYQILHAGWDGEFGSGGRLVWDEMLMDKDGAAVQIIDVTEFDNISNHTQATFEKYIRKAR